MRIVRDETGRRYFLRKRSRDQWLLRDLETGETTYRDPEALEFVDGESPLTIAAATVPEPMRTVVTAVATERTLGLLVEIDRDGPLAVRTMLDRYDFCERDLHGTLGEFRAAGLLEERQIAGEAGYGTTTLASEALATLQGE